MSVTTRALHPLFGVEALGVDVTRLAQVVARHETRRDGAQALVRLAPRAGDEKARRDLAVDASHRREVRRVAGHRRKRIHPAQRTEVVAQPAQLGGRLGDQPAAKVMRVLALECGQ